MEKYTAHDIAEYIINSYLMMCEDGYYHVHYNSVSGLNYKGSNDQRNFTVLVPCDYAKNITRYEFEKKQNENDPDFMKICNKLAEKLNTEIKSRNLK